MRISCCKGEWGKNPITYFASKGRPQLYIVGWVQDSCQAPKLIQGHTLHKVRSKFDILRYHFLSFKVPQQAGPRARARAMRSA